MDTKTNPQHGQRRDWRIEKKQQESTFILPDGQSIDVDSSADQSACEQYCGHCTQWVTIKGLIPDAVLCPSCKTKWDNPPFKAH